MREVLRCEKKYLLNYENYLTSRNYFSKVLHPDKHNKLDGYMIRSLYLDTVYDDFYNKIDGLELRRKIRLRMINSFFFLQKSIKCRQIDVFMV